jgi:hypothetical protein
VDLADLFSVREQTPVLNLLAVDDRRCHMHLLSDVYLWGCTLTQVGRNTSVELPITAMVDHPAGIRGRVDRRNERRHISHLTSKVVTSHVASHCCTRSGLVRESSVLQQQHPLQASLQLSRLAFRDCLAPTQQHSLWQTDRSRTSWSRVPRRPTSVQQRVLHVACSTMDEHFVPRNQPRVRRLQRCHLSTRQ